MYLIVGPERSIVDELNDASELHRGGRARLAVAWARQDGVIWLLDAVRERLNDLQVVVGLNERGTTVEALLRLLPATSHLWVYFKHPRQTFHPKLYVLDGGQAGPVSLTLVVGSSNLTTGGLLTNVEASLRINSTEANEADERNLRAAIEVAWEGYTNTPFAHAITGAGDIERLYRSGYLVTEQTIRRERRRQTATIKSSRDLPMAPPPFRPLPVAAHLDIPFELAQEPPAEESPPETEDPSGVPPLPYRFFVRTLTGNDVRKLRGEQVGTFEPDLGQTARDRYPAFWGWPGEYAGLARKEWRVQAQLITRLTPPDGVGITLTLWYREARPGHAAEHRFGLGPIGTVRAVVPDDFDTASLVVFERAPSDSQYAFVVKLLTPADAGYPDYHSYLTQRRPEHRFGYGPAQGA